ncbi:hypothetical protein SMALA_7909 [Streptomyces malaysiensis subsp. malaysiensis]|nr:hypothetical protein SMALA_7909 [Streptomyces malaysiensis]
MGVRPATAARVVAGAEAAGRPRGPERDREEVPDWDGLAGCARPLRAAGHAAYAFPQVGGGRDVRSDAADPAGEGGRHGRRRVADVGRFHDRPRPPARGRSPKRGLRDPAPGRSRDSPTSWIHLACDGRGASRPYPPDFRRVLRRPRLGLPAPQLRVPKSTYDRSKGIPNVGPTFSPIVQR